MLRNDHRPRRRQFFQQPGAVGVVRRVIVQLAQQDEFALFQRGHQGFAGDFPLIAEVDDALGGHRRAAARYQAGGKQGLDFRGVKKTALWMRGFVPKA